MKNERNICISTIGHRIGGTGWSGANAASGAKRIALKATRAIINAILCGELDETKTLLDPTFGLRVPQHISGVEGVALTSLDAWGGNENAYTVQNFIWFWQNNLTKLQQYKIILS